jgi:hypothetical protein
MPASRWWEKIGAGSQSPPARECSVYEDRAPEIDDGGQSKDSTPVGEIDPRTGRFMPDPEWRGSAGGWRPLGEWIRRR